MRGILDEDKTTAGTFLKDEFQTKDETSFMKE